MKIAHMTAAVALVGSIGLATNAQAETWSQLHPRRAEVNGRLADQNYRINQGVGDGQLSPRQAHQLRADDRSIRTEERADSAVNGGHITPREQHQINQQENANSAAIYGERHF